MDKQLEELRKRVANLERRLQEERTACPKNNWCYPGRGHDDRCRQLNPFE